MLGLFPFLKHWTIVSNVQFLSALLHAALLLFGLAWSIDRGGTNRTGSITIALALAAVVFCLAHVDPAWLYLAPQVGINVFMLYLFGRTLLPGHEALITRVARYVQGSLPDDGALYTRRATWAWCVFFIATIVISILLFVLGSLTAWSTFANVMSLPLLGLMFFCEYAWRVLRHPDFAPAGFLAVVRAFRKMGRTV
jgi:uncharacterized membrane protein